MTILVYRVNTMNTFLKIVHLLRKPVPPPITRQMGFNDGYVVSKL